MTRSPLLPLALALLLAGCGDKDEGTESDYTPGDGLDGDDGGDDGETDDVDEDGVTEADGDCDDDDATIYPGADETPYDGIDQDCDGDDLVDVDGDGAEGGDDGTDCDDDDATIYPGADETPYDGIDQDCDGEDLVDVDGDGAEGGDDGTDCDDEDADRAPDLEDTAYDGVDSDCGLDDDYDADADGFVPDAYVGMATADVDGTGALPGGDCDDDNADVNPDAAEVWYDDVDQNCDGNDDDQDGDTFDLGDDCDDEDAAVNPDATEVCNNGVDDDCDGSAGACVLDAAVDLSTDATVQFYGASNSSGPYARGSGDHNGDGYSDILLGDEGTDDVFVLNGPTTGSVDAETSADVTLDGSGNFGVNVTWAGDLDADGYDEVLIGADLANSQAGAVWVAAGPLSSGTEADLVEITGVASSRMGVYPQIAGVGDVDGDGNGDFLIGEIRTNHAWLFLGPVTADAAATDGDTQFTGGGSTSTGIAMAGPGDLNGDGLDDLLIDAAYATAASVSGASAAGAVYIVYGPASTSINIVDADVVIGGETHYALTGYGLSGAGDVNGDGSPDFIMGSYNDEAWMFYGPVTADTSVASADVTFSSTTTSDWFGHSVSDAGDVNGDGFGDVLIGDFGSGSNGAAFLWYGPVSGDHSPATADVTISGGAGWSHGFSVASAGDYNADGTDDIAVWSRSNAGSSGDAGVSVLLGMGW
jgi:hypothetical protein